MKFKDVCRTRIQTIQEFTKDRLNGDEYGSGLVESARDQAKNVTEAFGRLLTIMADKNILGRKDVYHIVTGYHEESPYEIVEEEENV